jgi:hypothetical protein
MSSNDTQIDSQTPSPDFSTVSAPSSVPLRKKRHPLRIVIIAVVIVLLLAAAGLGVLRYFGPEEVAQSYLNDYFANNFSGALTLVCPAQQATMRAAFQLDATNLPTGIKIDTSHLVYSLQSESLNSATIAVSGSIDAGSSATSSSIHYSMGLNANDLWWCVDTQHFTLIP